MNSIEEIAQDIVTNCDNQELVCLFNPKDFWEQRELLIEFPRWIRNHYKLWQAHPLCVNAHPDDVSAIIVKRVRELITAP